MATLPNPNSSSNSYFDIDTILGQAKQNFWSNHAHLSEEQRCQLWSKAAMQSTQSSMAHRVPRSMMPFSTPDMTQFPTPGLASMDRSLSSHTVDNSSLRRSNTTYSDWQSMSQEPTNDYTLYSDTMRRQPAHQSLNNLACYSNDSLVEYSVDDFVSNFSEPNSSTTAPLPIPQHPQQLNVQLTPQWSTSSDVSSPSTPSTSLMTPGTLSSTMSRQVSRNILAFDNVSMSRIPSDSSCMLPILPEDGLFPYSLDVQSKPMSGHAMGSHFLSFAGSSNEGFLSSSVPSVHANSHDLASSDNEQSYLVEDMRRSASTSSSEGYASEGSAPSSTCSRQSQREREILAQAASRKIAPKAIEDSDEIESSPSDAQMTSIRSEDGSSKTVGVLSKTPYVRPQHPKIKCNHCDERPDGFRGTHELDRHFARAHASKRKGYICIDSSPDKKFLANCKHCRNKKVYGAYYNAAAHLRRAHFHPRKRGRKGKNDEKRGGIGGGDHPAMEILKQHWIEEVEVDNPVPRSPESVSDDAPEPADEPTFDPAYNVDVSASYPQHQMPLPMNTQVPIDNSQYIDYGMTMHASEPIVFDSTAFFDPNIAATTDMSNFQFDAYMGQ